MKFRLSWLKKYIETDASAQSIADILTQIGFEVEPIPDESWKKKFVIADVLKVVSHPNAEKLSICDVSDGASVFSVVCGAKNVKSGMKTVLAKVGAIMPNGGMKIKKSKIRGEVSFGMLCSSDELGLNSDVNYDGILELDQNRTVGDVFFFEDPIFDLSILPNRGGDCSGVYGIARELAVAGVGILKKIKLDIKESSRLSPLSIKVEDGSSSFSCRVMFDVKNDFKSPDWLVDYLEVAGMRSVSPIVDISNYAMLTLSSPVHIYDLDKVDSDVISVGFLKTESIFNALNDEQYSISSSDLVVKDKNCNILSLAGIIGGASSSCSESTKNIIIECAFFDSETITKTSRLLGISTNSSYMFERNVDSCAINFVVDFVASLIKEVSGGSISNQSFFEAKKFKPLSIMFNMNECRDVCSSDIKDSEIKGIFNSLGCDVVNASDFILNVTPPSWRGDLKNFMDLVEEIIRFIGSDRIVEQALPLSCGSIIDINFNFNVRKVLSSIGMDEVITWSFANSKVSSLFGSLPEEIYLENPPSEKLNVARNSLIVNMIELLYDNFHNGNKSISIFEIGKTYKYENETYKESNVITGLRSGKTNSVLHKTDRSFDFFDIKADFLSVVSLLNIEESNLKFVKFSCDYYSKWESAECYLKSKLIGRLGRVHPNVLEENKLEVFCFEVFVDEIRPQKAKKCYISNKYPSSDRDFCFIISNSIPLGEVAQNIKKIHAFILDVFVGDVYVDDELTKLNSLSVLFSVKIGAIDKTLISDEINKVSDMIVEYVEEIHKGKLRDGV